MGLNNSGVDIFSDASGDGTRWAGAYIIGRYGEPEGVMLRGCTSAFDAELETAIIALRRCLADGRVPFAVHIDIQPIDDILWKGRNGRVKELRSLLEATATIIVDDAQQFPEYRRCHHAARSMVGCNGDRHPFRVRELRKANIVSAKELKGGLD